MSGVKQDMLGALLTWMQDRNATGILFIGVPGAGKSATAKAAGNFAEIETIAFDLAGMQDSLVGKSGQNMRQALKVVDAISGGEVLVIATCNSINNIPPELRRRFTFGTFFFDVPSRSGKDAIWDLYKKKPHPKADGALSKKQVADMPNDEEWTGAEIEKCCQIAWRLKSTLKEAAAYIVPVAKTAPDQLAALRKTAHNTYINAAEPGLYDASAYQPGKQMLNDDVRRTMI